MNSLVACGIDIEERNRFRKYFVDETPHSLITEIFTPNEIQRNLVKKDLLFAMGFTCKEAVFKAFGLSWTNSPVHWKQIELLFDESEPFDYQLILSAYAKELFLKSGCKELKTEFTIHPDYVICRAYLLKS